MAVILGLPGGAQAENVDTTPVAVDLTALARCEVLIWCDTDDLWFGWADSATSPALTVSGASAASRTSNKADRAGMSVGKLRTVSAAYPFLIVRTVSGTGALVHVKVTKNPQSDQ